MLDRLLICTDLDRTLIPNGPEPLSPGANEHFAHLVAHPRVELTFVSGRDRSLVEEAIAGHDLPVPDFVIGDVGTTIYHVGDRREWVRQTRWDQIIGPDWGNRGATALATFLAGFPALRPQEPEHQNRFKLSYYVGLDADPGELEPQVLQRLAAAGINARLIWSVDESRDVGLLDVIPRGASKYHAIEVLMEQQGYTLGNTVFCGDSGNDLEVLVSPVRAVAVANATPEVKQDALAMSAENGNLDQLYIASGGFFGMNGNYSAGMLEGIAHFWPELTAWMGFATDAA